VANTTLGGLASVAGGGKFANGAITAAFQYLFNDRFHDKSAAIAAADSEGVTAPHFYAMDRILICDFSNPACTFGNVHFSVMATQIPGYAGVVVDGGIYLVRIPYYGTVGRVEVYDDGSSVTNETAPGHALYYGYITRTIEVGKEGIYLSGYGEGQNAGLAPALLNAIFGPILWNSQNLFTKDYFNKNFGPQSPSQ